MRALFAGFTTRGKSFLAAGAAAGIAGLATSERALLSIGCALILLPLCAVLATSRARYRIRCARRIYPRRVPAGQNAMVSLRLENVSRLPTGLLLAEETVPYQLGTRPRFVLDRIEQGGHRELTYPVQSGNRGKFSVGPLQVRVADSFGLVELSRSFASRTMLVVTPAITPLPDTPLAGMWQGEGGGRTRTADAAGEEDVIPRPYQDGDELRRVHWRSTARHGELMVRREEQRWRNRAVLLLDTRSQAHGGSGAGSSFEYAVSATASIGVHLARSGISGQLVTDVAPATAPGAFEDVLLDSLAVIKLSRGTQLTRGLDLVPGGAPGVLVVVAGRMSVAEARQLAAWRRDSGPAFALLLAAPTWAAARHSASRAAARAANGAGNGAGLNGAGLNGAAQNGAGQYGAAQNWAAQNGAAQYGGASGAGNGARTGAAASDPATSEADAAAAILRSAGWRAVTVRAGTPLGAAWEQLHFHPGLDSTSLGVT